MSPVAAINSAAAPNASMILWRKVRADGRSERGASAESAAIFGSPSSELADVFVPDVGMSRDVVGEQADAFGGRQVHDAHPAASQPVEPSREVHRLAGDDRADPELPHQAAAVPAGGERRDQDLVAVAPLASRLAERVGLAVRRRIALLHPAISAAAEQSAPLVEERGADRNAPLTKALPGFVNRDAEKGVVVEQLF